MPRKDIAGTDKGSQMQGWTPPSFPKPFHLKCNALGQDLGSVVRLDLNDGASEEITIGAAGLGPALQYNKLGGRYTTMLYDAVANEWNMCSGCWNAGMQPPLQSGMLATTKATVCRTLIW